MDEPGQVMLLKKLGFLYTHPIQYFVPFHRQLTESGICESKVLFCKDTAGGYFDKEFGKPVKWDIPLKEGYKSTVLPASPLQKLGGFFANANTSVASHVKKKDVDVLVVHGWGYFTAVFAILLAKFRGVKVWLRSETPLKQDIKTGGLKRAVKKLLLKYILFKCVDKFLYIGKQNRLFYKDYGVKDKDLIFCPYCVENARFTSLHEALGTKEEAKRKLGIDSSTFVVLFSGKLIDKKNPMDLLQAFYQSRLQDSKLIFLGDGALLENLQRFTSDHKLQNVVFAGFKNQTEIPQYYQAADVLVLPSGVGETWGLVVNEAMNFSLPVIASDVVGSTDDLVLEGVNGYTYHCGNFHQLSERLSLVYADKSWRENAAEVSRKHIKEYSYDTIIKNIATAL